MLNVTAFQNKINTVYKDFTDEISEHAVSLTSLHYQAMPNIRQNWQTVIPYMPHIEKSIIDRARLFVCINIGARNKTMTRELLPRMAEYIAEYTTRGDKTLKNGATIVENKINVYNVDFTHDEKQHLNAENKKEQAINDRLNKKDIKRMFSAYSDCRQH